MNKKIMILVLFTMNAIMYSMQPNDRKRYQELYQLVIKALENNDERTVAYLAKVFQNEDESKNDQKKLRAKL